LHQRGFPKFCGKFFHSKSELNIIDGKESKIGVNYKQKRKANRKMEIVGLLAGGCAAIKETSIYD